MVPLALGSQTGGSTIRPASYCGVYGFKPTHGLIPRHGMFQLSRTLDHVGALRAHARGPRAARRAARGLRRARSRLAAARARALPRDRRRGAAAAADVRLREDGALGRASTPTPARPSRSWSSTSAIAWRRSSWSSAGRGGARVAPDHHGRRDGGEPRPGVGDAGARGSRPRCARSIERGREVRALDYLARARAASPRSTRASTSCSRSATTPSSPRPPPAPRRAGSSRRAIRPSARCGRSAACPRSACPLMQGANGLPLGVQLVGPAPRRRAAAAHRALAGGSGLARRLVSGAAIRPARVAVEESRCSGWGPWHHGAGVRIGPLAAGLHQAGGRTVMVGGNGSTDPTPSTGLPHRNTGARIIDQGD